MKVALVCYYCFDVEWVGERFVRHNNARRWHTCQACKECFERDY